MLFISLNIAQSSGTVGGCYWIPQRKTAKGPHSWEKVSQTRTWSLLFQYLNMNVWTFSWLAHSAPSPMQTDMSMMRWRLIFDKFYATTNFGQWQKFEQDLKLEIKQKTNTVVILYIIITTAICHVLIWHLQCQSASHRIVKIVFVMAATVPVIMMVTTTSCWIQNQQITLSSYRLCQYVNIYYINIYMLVCIYTDFFWSLNSSL